MALFAACASGWHLAARPRVRVRVLRPRAERCLSSLFSTAGEASFPPARLDLCPILLSRGRVLEPLLELAKLAALRLATQRGAVDVADVCDAHGQIAVHEVVIAVRAALRRRRLACQLSAAFGVRTTFRRLRRDGMRWRRLPFKLARRRWPMRRRPVSGRCGRPILLPILCSARDAAGPALPLVADAAA